MTYSQVQQMASLLASLDSLEKAPRKSSKKEGRKEKPSKKEKIVVAEGGIGRYSTYLLY